MLNCNAVSRAALVPLFIMVRQCSCKRNIFYFHFLLPSPPHSVFCLISSFLCISFSAYFLILPSLGPGGTLHVPLASHVSPVQAPSSKFSANEQCVNYSLQSTEGAKNPPVYEGPPKARAEIWITSAWEYSVCYNFPVFWWSAYFVSVAGLNWQCYFLPS